MNEPNLIAGRNAALMGALVLLLAVLGWHPRWRAQWAWFLVVVGAGFGLYLEVLAPLDVVTLPRDSDLVHDILLLLVWVVFGGLVRASGRLRLPGPPILVATLAGALMGEIAAAAVLAAGARDRRGAARLALAAAGGGLLGRVGDPALLLLGDRGNTWLLVPLGLLCALVAWPTRAQVTEQGEGSILLTAVVVGTAALAAVPGMALLALAAGAVVLAVTSRRHLRAFGFVEPAWLLASVALVLMAVAGGAPEMMGRGIEQVQEFPGPHAPVALSAVGVVLSALGGGAAAALSGAAFIDRALSLTVPHAVPAFTAGLAVGGLGPLVVSGGIRHGLGRWALQVLVGLVWVWVVF